MDLRDRITSLVSSVGVKLSEEDREALAARLYRMVVDWLDADPSRREELGEKAADDIIAEFSPKKRADSGDDAPGGGLASILKRILEELRRFLPSRTRM